MRLCRLASGRSRISLGRADSRRRCSWRGEACWLSRRSAQQYRPSAQQTERSLWLPPFAERGLCGLNLLGNGGQVDSRIHDPFQVARARRSACSWPFAFQARELSWRPPLPSSLLPLRLLNVSPRRPLSTLRAAARLRAAGCCPPARGLLWCSSCVPVPRSPPPSPRRQQDTGATKTKALAVVLRASHAQGGDGELHQRSADLVDVAGRASGVPVYQGRSGHDHHGDNDQDGGDDQGFSESGFFSRIWDISRYIRIYPLESSRHPT